MNRVIYKVYKGEPKEIIYMTFSMDDAVRKYFMYIKEHSIVQIWKGQQLIGEYTQSIYNLKTIKHDLEEIIKAA